jgi:hypothetical protein
MSGKLPSENAGQAVLPCAVLEAASPPCKLAMRLSPLDPVLCSMQNGIGFVHFLIAIQLHELRDQTL